MEDMYVQWRKELIEAGLLAPDQEIDNMKLMEMYQTFQIEKMKSMMKGSFADLIPSDIAASKSGKTSSATPKESTPIHELSTETSDIDTREGIRKALNALLTVAKGANYCMFVVDRAWINFRYRKSKDNLHLQVAGNQYISPMKLKDSDVKHLTGMGIAPEEGSIDIFCREFDDKPRNLDGIIDVILEIFNEVYHVSEGESAYIELDLAKGEDESVRKDIAQHFRTRDGKQFKFKWAKKV